MDNGIDIEVFGEDGARVAAVEVKRGQHINREAAAQWRRNMIAHGIVPGAAYFLLVTNQRMYLWRQAATEIADARMPDADGPTDGAIRPFLSETGLHSATISEAALELATAAWFDELAQDSES